MSGQVGNYPDGRPLDGDVAGQARQVFANLAAILTDLGASPAHVVKMTTLVVGEANLAGFRAARDEVFGEWYPDRDDPAHTLMVVTALAAPEFLIEIEAVVAIPSGR